MSAALEYPLCFTCQAATPPPPRPSNPFLLSRLLDSARDLRSRAGGALRDIRLIRMELCLGIMISIEIHNFADIQA